MTDERAAAGEAGPKLIAGLGNPGDEYRGTRHNVGFLVADELARRRGLEIDRLECRSLLTVIDGATLVKPQTFMNRSGFSLRCLAELHGFETNDILVIYDDLALPLGRLRLRPGGSPAGHRGMESIVENLRTDRVARLRVGIARAQGAPPAEAWSQFVLSRFDDGEKEVLKETITRATEACEHWLLEGAGSAMNRFNG